MMAAGHSMTILMAPTAVAKCRDAFSLNCARLAVSVTAFAPVSEPGALALLRPENGVAVDGRRRPDLPCSLHSDSRIYATMPPHPSSCRVS